jgi:co-chaperonin GroES (HSP10)
MSIRPWGHYIAVVDPPAQRNDGTASGIVLPPGVGLDLLDKGIVVGVGQGAEEASNTPEGFGVGSAVWYCHDDALVLDGELKFVRTGDLICWEPNPAGVPA